MSMFLRILSVSRMVPIKSWETSNSKGVYNLLFSTIYATRISLFKNIIYFSTTHHSYKAHVNDVIISLHVLFFYYILLFSFNFRNQFVYKKIFICLKLSCISSNLIPINIIYPLKTKTRRRLKILLKFKANFKAVFLL